LDAQVPLPDQIARMVALAAINRSQQAAPGHL